LFSLATIYIPSELLCVIVFFAGWRILVFLKSFRLAATGQADAGHRLPATGGAWESEAVMRPFLLSASILLLTGPLLMAAPA